MTEALRAFDIRVVDRALLHSGTGPESFLSVLTNNVIQKQGFQNGNFYFIHSDSSPINLFQVFVQTSWHPERS